MESGCLFPLSGIGMHICALASRGVGPDFHATPETATGLLSLAPKRVQQKGTQMSEKGHGSRITEGSAGWGFSEEPRGALPGAPGFRPSWEPSSLYPIFPFGGRRRSRSFYWDSPCQELPGAFSGGGPPSFEAGRERERQLSVERRAACDSAASRRLSGWPARTCPASAGRRPSWAPDAAAESA